jgi:hypothetical protein
MILIDSDVLIHHQWRGPPGNHSGQLARRSAYRILRRRGLGHRASC